MYEVTISSPQVFVQSRKHKYAFAIDGSLPNPLEATYAALAGCAGVYTIKACKSLGKSYEGIKISGVPFNLKENPLLISKWVTKITFPESWTESEKAVLIDDVQKCAVKELLIYGHEIEFITEAN